MTIKDYELEQERRFQLGPDIVQECQAVDSYSEDRREEWAPLFDPDDFNKRHGPLMIEKYRLSPLEL